MVPSKKPDGRKKNRPRHLHNSKKLREGMERKKSTGRGIEKKKSEPKREKKVLDAFFTNREGHGTITRKPSEPRGGLDRNCQT